MKKIILWTLSISLLILGIGSFAAGHILDILHGIVFLALAVVSNPVFISRTPNITKIIRVIMPIGLVVLLLAIPSSPTDETTTISNDEVNNTVIDSTPEPTSTPTQTPEPTPEPTPQETPEESQNTDSQDGYDGEIFLGRGDEFGETIRSKMDGSYDVQTETLDGSDDSDDSDDSNDSDDSDHDDNSSDNHYDESNDIVYATKTGDKYHTSSCSSVRKSKREMTRGEAESRGLERCSRCRP